MNFNNSKLIKNCGLVFDAVGVSFSALGDAAGYISDAAREARLKQRMAQKNNLRLALHTSNKDLSIGMANNRQEIAEYCQDKAKAKYFADAQADVESIDEQLKTLEAELDL